MGLDRSDRGNLRGARIWDTGDEVASCSIVSGLYNVICDDTAKCKYYDGTAQEPKKMLKKNSSILRDILFCL